MIAELLHNTHYLRTMPSREAIWATCAYCSLSAAVNASTPMRAAGWPVSASLSSIILSSSAASTSAAIRRRRSSGMSRGPSSPSTGLASRDGYPASTTVGICGAMGDGNDLDLAGLRVGSHRGVGLHRQLDSVFAEIDRRLGDVAVGNLDDRQPVFLDEAVEDEFGKSRRHRIARLVRLGARQRHEFGP